MANECLQKIMNINYLSSDVLVECISRSGLCPLDSTGGDGSTFALLVLVCLREPLCDDMDLFKEEFINKFMILHHNIAVKSKNFNWNWD